MSADDFQTKYASVMESMLKSAVAETTKLFETMVDELKAEISRIKKENEDLKSRCSRVESARSRPTVSAGSEPPPGPNDGSEKRDTATQCDLVPFHMMLVEQCQPLRHSSLHNQKQLSDYKGMEYILQDHNYDTHGEGDSQMGTLLVKQESVLKEEEVESTVVSGQVLSDKADSLWASGTDNEGPFTNKVCSTREVPLPQRHEDTQLALEPRLLGTYSSLQGGQNQSSEPEHSFVISLAAIKDDIEEESHVSQKMSEVSTQGESEKHQMVFAQHQSEAGSLEKEKPSVVPQQCRREGKTSENEQTDGMQSAEKPLAQPVPLNKGEACDELKNGVAEVASSSQPNMPVRRKRGRPPKKAKRLQQKEILKSPSSDVPTVQEVQKSSTIRVEEVEVSSANDTAKITSSESSQTSSPVQSKESSSIITLSVQESRTCSSKKAKLSESQQPSLDIKEGAIRAPFTEVSPAIETQCTPPAESPQAPSVQPRERCTSVTLQDAMLLVEAMNQSMEENTHEAAGNLPIPTPTNEAQPHIKVVKPKQQHAVSLSNTTTSSIPPSTAPTQTSVQSLQQHCPHCLITPVASSRQSNTVPHRIILVQRSSLMPHNTASQTSAQLPTVMSTVSVENNSTLPGSTVADLPLKTPSSVPQKTAGLTLASKDAQSVSLLYPKVTIIIPRHNSPVTAKKNQSQNIHVTAQKSDNTSDYKKSPKQTAHVSETLNAHTETHPSLNIPVELVPTSVSSQTFEQKRAAVVRLTKLPFPISTKESVLVSEWPTNSSSDSLSILKEGSTHEKTSSSVVISKQSSEMRVLSSDICHNLKETSLSVSVNTSQISEEPNDIQKRTSLSMENCTTLKESPNSGYVPTPASSKELEPVFEKSTMAIHTTEPSAVSGTADERTSNLDKEIRIAVQDCALPNEGPIEEKPSDALIHLTSITSKDTSDPHFQMTKTQFLAQLSVAPVTQDQKQVSSNDSVDTRASCAETNISDKKRLQRTSLLAQLRSHVQTHLQAKRTETNPEPCTETETQTETWTLSSKKPRLEGDHPYSKNTTCEAILLCPNNPGAAEDVIFLKETTNDLTPISFRGSELYEDDVKPSRTVCESSVSSSMSKATSESTPVSPRRSSRDAATPKITTNYSVCPRSTSSTRDIANSKMTKTGGSPNNTKTTPLRPKRTSLRRDSASPKKTKSTSVSPRTSSLSKNGTSPNGVSSKKTRETTSVKKHRLSQDGPSPKLRVVIAKLGKAGAAKTIAKNKNSNQSKVQNGAKTSQLAENPASCEALKKCTAKAVWTPPKTPTSKTPPEGGKRSGHSPVKTETVSPKSMDDTLVYPHSVSLHPIPVKAPPVVSPLQPLSVIGRRLLKNQCGECGRVLSSSAALESHVRLHAGWRPFSCKLCGKGFTDSKGLKRHGRVHRNGRIHICQQCGKGFVYRFGLTKHLQAVHRRIKPYVCQICNKGFFTKIDVEAHIRMHTGEKPFHCNLCDKKFTRRVELNVHLRWHNGEKRHWCPYCGKGFLDFNNMKRHKYIHTGEKPHSCPHCPKHFTQSGHLKKHVKNVHKIL